MVMRAFLPSLMLVLLPATAQAMNWEGKDDWMTDMEPAVVYEESAPHAKPPPDKTCKAVEKKLKDNPYEQVPLDRHACRPAEVPPGAGG
jgi:hypothetical protein